jgi:hypothetical protein
VPAPGDASRAASPPEQQSALDNASVLLGFSFRVQEVRLIIHHQIGGFIAARSLAGGSQHGCSVLKLTIFCHQNNKTFHLYNFAKLIMLR